MKGKKTQQDIIHDLRARVGVLDIMFDVINEKKLTPDEQELFQGGRQCFREFKNDVNSLAEFLGVQLFPSAKQSISFLADNKEPLQKPLAIIREHTKKECILIIDDDPEIRKQFSRELNCRGRNVITLEKGEDLLVRPVDLKLFSMAVVDYEFENSALDGFDVIEYLQSQKVKNIHLCTGCYDDPKVIQKAHELGIVSIISKPIPKHFFDLL